MKVNRENETKPEPCGGILGLALTARKERDLLAEYMESNINRFYQPEFDDLH